MSISTAGPVCPPGRNTTTPSWIRSEWMRPMELKISFADFLRLPRNNAYKYEYLDGRACLSPRPKYYHALLDPIGVDAADGTEDQLRRFPAPAAEQRLQV